jgi:hypothetical protein
MKKSDGFYVLFVNNSTPTLKKFKTRVGAEKFIKKFRSDPDHAPDDGYWIDLFFEGTIHEQDDYFSRS